MVHPLFHAIAVGLFVLHSAMAAGPSPADDGCIDALEPVQVDGLTGASLKGMPAADRLRQRVAAIAVSGAVLMGAYYFTPALMHLAASYPAAVAAERARTRAEIARYNAEYAAAVESRRGDIHNAMSPDVTAVIERARAAHYGDARDDILSEYFFANLPTLSVADALGLAGETTRYPYVTPRHEMLQRFAARNEAILSTEDIITLSSANDGSPRPDAIVMSYADHHAGRLSQSDILALSAEAYDAEIRDIILRLHPVTP